MRLWLHSGLAVCAMFAVSTARAELAIECGTDRASAPSLPPPARPAALHAHPASPTVWHPSRSVHLVRHVKPAAPSTPRIAAAPAPTPAPARAVQAVATACASHAPALSAPTIAALAPTQLPVLASLAPSAEPASFATAGASPGAQDAGPSPFASFPSLSAPNASAPSVSSPGQPGTSASPPVRLTETPLPIQPGSLVPSPTGLPTPVGDAPPQDQPASATPVTDVPAPVSYWMFLPAAALWAGSQFRRHRRPTD